MIIFAFYFPLKYLLILTLKLRAHYINLLMKHIRFFLNKMANNIITPSCKTQPTLKMIGTFFLLNYTKEIQSLMTSYKQDKTITMLFYLFVCKYTFNCITQNLKI
jgi:hypothetical protein